MMRQKWEGFGENKGVAGNMANCDEDKTEDAKVSGKRVEREEEELIETKRQKLMEEIKLSLPQNLSKTQLKKQIKTKYREKMKSEWKSVRHGLCIDLNLFTGDKRRRKKN